MRRLCRAERSIRARDRQALASLHVLDLVDVAAVHLAPHLLALTERPSLPQEWSAVRGRGEAKVNVVEKHKALSRVLYVNGAYAAGEGEAIPVINPATEEMISEITEATEREIEVALGFAAAAQRKWWALSGAERADIMHEVTRATRAMSASLAESLTREQGKTYKEATDEIGWCASATSYYAEISRQEGGRVHGPSAPGQLHMTIKEPLGIVAVIIPFNYPYLLLFWEVAAALGAGNAVIIKPSDLTSLSTLMLMEAFAALPPGLV